MHFCGFSCGDFSFIEGLSHFAVSVSFWLVRFFHLCRCATMSTPMIVSWKVRARCRWAFRCLHRPTLDFSVLSLGLDSHVLFDSMFPWDIGGPRNYKGFRIFVLSRQAV